MGFQKTFRSLRRAMRGAFAVRQAANRAVRPCLMEPLERRQMLNAVVGTVFGTEALKQDGGQRINNPGIVLIFWGSYWGSTSSSAATGVFNTTYALFNQTNYLSVIAQYGTSGAAYLSSAEAYVSSDPSSGTFTTTTIDNVVSAAISSGQIGTYSNAIYEVITAPGIVSSYAGAGGFNFQGSSRTEAWIEPGGGPSISYDSMTLAMGHETAEAMTDPGGNGIEFNPGASFTGAGSGNQIGDYEGNAYSFREPNGILVQPLWSQAHGDWEAGDGNTQRFYLAAQWSGSSFTGTYDLTLNGDQYGSGYNDSFSLFTGNSGNSVSVTMNGESESFDNYVIRYLTVNTGSGTNTVNVYGTSYYAGVTINSDGPDTVNIGLGSTQSIFSDIYLSNPPDYTTINVNDSSDTTGRAVVITSSTIYDITPATIHYISSDTNTVNVTTGEGVDYVYVYSTSRTTNLYSSGGRDVVYIGYGGLTTSIFGTLNIYNSPSYSHITLYDYNDAVGRTVGVSATSVTGLSPAAINFVSTDVASLSIYAGPGTSSAGNTFNVTGTPNNGSAPITYIGTGATASNVTTTVNVTGTAGELDLDGDGGFSQVFVGFGSVAGIAGLVDVVNATGTTYLYINDSTDSTGRSAALRAGSLTWTSYAATIEWTASATVTGGVTYAEIYAGTGGNNISVINTSHFYYYTSLINGAGNDTVNISATTGTLYDNGGAGTDVVNIGSASHTLTGIAGFTDVYSSSGTMTLNLFDEGDITGRNATLNSSQITGLSPANIQYDTSDTLVHIYLGTGNDSLTVSGFATGVTYTVDGGTGNNTLIGPNQTNTWDITGSNSGTLDGVVTFSKFQSLTGGTGSDDFAFATAGSVTGHVVGGGGTDSLDYSSRSVGVTVNLSTGTATSTGGVSGISNVIGTTGNDTITAAAGGSTIRAFGGDDTLIGGAGNDTFYLASTQTAGTNINGGGGVNTLEALNENNTWHINGANSGTINTFVFANIQDLIGGNMDDTFIIAAAGSLAGLVNGGAGDFGLDESAKTTNVTINLGAKTATNTGGFTNVGTMAFTGGSGNNTLIGDGGPDVFTVLGANVGTVNAPIDYSGFGNLTGGSGTNTFNFATAGTESGIVNGVTAGATLSYAGAAKNVTVNLATNTATSTGGISHIAHFIGGTMTNTLIGPNTVNTWTINGSNTGNVNGTITFTGFQNLTGGTNNDTFKIVPTGLVTGKITGAGGTNTLAYSIVATAAVNLATSTASGTGGIANINAVSATFATNTLIGANTVNTWNITAANAGNINGTFTFHGFNTLTGGTNSDNFVFAAAGSISGKANGGTGTNSLNFAAKSSAVSVNLQSLTATNTGGFTGISSFVGGIGSNTLTGANASNAWTITSSNAGNINGAVTFSHFGNLTGGNSLDTFKFAAAAAVTGHINSGGGTGDWLDYSSYTTAVGVNLTAGTATGTAGIIGIENVRGGNGVDTLTGNTFGNILIGGNAADTITAGTGRSILIGRGGADHVVGHTADDIVIGGSTTFDANFAALQSILAEWKSANTFAVRVSHIKSGGGLNGTNKFILGATVTDDGLINTLTGGGGNNWFFKGAHDVITDLHVTDQVN